MKKIKISFDDKYFKSDEIIHGRVVKKFLEELMTNVFKKANLYWQVHSDLTGESELPLLHNERNLYSIFASAIDEITPVHLSEWSFNQADTGVGTKRVDFWCLNKNGGEGKAINYFIELKKNGYCLSEGRKEEFTSTTRDSVKEITEQVTELKGINPNWLGDGDVYLGIIVTHAYCSAKKEQEHNETQVRDGIHNLLDKRLGAQLFFATWTLSDDNKVQWENDKCKFISIAGIAISTKR